MLVGPHRSTEADLMVDRGRSDGVQTGIGGRSRTPLSSNTGGNGATVSKLSLERTGVSWYADESALPLRLSARRCASTGFLANVFIVEGGG
jgi:hypothetical protein